METVVILLRYGSDKTVLVSSWDKLRDDLALVKPGWTSALFKVLKKQLVENKN